MTQYDKCRNCANRLLCNNCVGCDGQCNFIPVKNTPDKLIKLKGEKI